DPVLPDPVPAVRANWTPQSRCRTNDDAVPACCLSQMTLCPGDPVPAVIPGDADARCRARRSNAW
ncbi:unnamed protein product, partial [Staurois parvus]